MKRGGRCAIFEAEDVDEQEVNGQLVAVPVFTGLFDAHWTRSSNGTGPREGGPQGSSLIAALQWARGRAPKIIVSIGDAGAFSAGEVAVSDYPPLPEPPPSLARRVQADEAVYHRSTSDPEILWEARFTLPRFGSLVDADVARSAAETYVETICADSQAVDPVIPLTTSFRGSYAATVLLSASTYEQAQAAGLRIQNAAFNAAQAFTPSLAAEEGVLMSFELYPHDGASPAQRRRATVG